MKFEAAGFGHELTGTAKDIEADGEGGPLESTGELDDAGELSGAVRLGSDGSELEAELSGAPLPQPTSAATTAATLPMRVHEPTPRRLATARTPTVGHHPPSSSLIASQGRTGGHAGCHYLADLPLRHFARCRIHQKQKPAITRAAAKYTRVSPHCSVQ